MFRVRPTGSLPSTMRSRANSSWPMPPVWRRSRRKVRGTGSGLSTAEAGLRLRYEFTRRFAPYVGLVWERAYGGTADHRRDEGEHVEDTRVVAGLRLWF